MDHGRFWLGYSASTKPDAYLGGVGRKDSGLWSVGALYRFSPFLGIATQYYSVKGIATGSTSRQLVFDVDHRISVRTSVYMLVAKSQGGTNPIPTVNGVPWGGRSNRYRRCRGDHTSLPKACMRGTSDDSPGRFPERMNGSCSVWRNVRSGSTPNEIALSNGES